MSTCKVVSEKDLLFEYHETPESVAEIRQLAEAAETGTLSTGKSSRIGRPPLSTDGTKILAFRIPASKADAFDRKALENGETRSQAFRELVDAYLEA